MNELQQQHGNIGKYLYESGRCAVAHAFNEPLVDPDDPDDTQRLDADLPVIKAVAEHLMESRLGIKSRRTYHREHLYELDGFRALFGSTLVASLKAKQSVQPCDFPALPLLSIRIRGKGKYQSFDRLSPTLVGFRNGCVYVRCVSGDGLVALIFGLNFPAERIEFDAQSGVAVGDDGSRRGARIGLDDLEFFRDHICNGELEIWDAEREVLLGRTDPLIPMNIDWRGTMRNLDRVQETLEIALAVRSAPEEGGFSI